MRKITTSAIALFCSIAGWAQTANQYLQTNLVSDGAVAAKYTDSNLRNPWGIARIDAAPLLFVAIEGSGVAAFYGGSGAKGPDTAMIAPASGTSHGVPTGVVPNPRGGWNIVTLDGTIQLWNSGSTAAVEVNNSASGASYAGCAIASPSGAQQLYVTNVNGGVEVYNESYQRVTASGPFTDPNLPAGYQPYGITELQAPQPRLLVTYFNPSVDAPGNGWVALFDLNGNFKRRLRPGPHFSAPSGLARAPGRGFGPFSGKLLVANHGTGQIAVFDPGTGAYLGVLRDSPGNPVAIPGLWGVAAAQQNAVYFTAGPNNGADGLYGSIKPAP